MKIVIYMNCIGNQIKKFFNEIGIECDHIVNYIEMKSGHSPDKYNDLLSNADYFIYQPFNKHHKTHIWYPVNLFRYLNDNCKKIKINYYRFKGFWEEPRYKTDYHHLKYDFDVKQNFEDSLKKLKMIDDNSDIQMFDFFVRNYKSVKLFHDCYHPTNFFIKEMCKQICQLIDINLVILFDSNIFTIDELNQNEMIIEQQIKEELNLTF
jgi:hypothetical protein